MYSSALDWFKLFRKDKPISLGAVDTAIITRFSKWPYEQKAIRVHDFNLRISKNIKDVCESLGIQCVTPQYARISLILALAHHGVMTAYIDFAVGHPTSEVLALLAGYISNVTPAMIQTFNEKIFVVPAVQRKFCNFAIV